MRRARNGDVNTHTVERNRLLIHTTDWVTTTENSPSQDYPQTDDQTTQSNVIRRLNLFILEQFSFNLGLPNRLILIIK